MELETTYKQPVNENIITLVWSRYFPYWPLFLLLIAICSGGAWLYLRYKVPAYESTATLIIKDERKGMEDSKIVESLNPLATKKIIENEIEVIKSRALMNKVVRELNLYAPVYEKGKWKDRSAYAFSPVKIEVRNPDSLQEVQKVIFSYNAANNVVKFNNRSYPLNYWVNTPWGNLKFSASNSNYRYKSPLYFTLINPKRVVQQLNSSIDVSSAGKLSSVINLKIKDEVPKRSEDIINTLIAAYEMAAVNDKNTLASNTLSFLDERLKSVSGDLGAIEQKLQQYRANKGAINISSQGQLFLENVSTNDQKMSDVNMKLAVLKQVEQYVSSQNRSAGLVPSTLGVDDQLLTGLLNRLYDAEIQHEKLKGTIGENNPEVTTLRDQIQKIRPDILDNIRSQQRSLEATKNNLFATNNSYSSLLQALPKQERDLVEISREQTVKSAIYSFLLQKREESALLNSSTVSDTRIVDRAESSLDPVGVGSKLIYAAAVILAIGLGIALITAREMLNRTIFFRQEIEAMTNFPVIGEIVNGKTKSALVLEDGKTSLIAEEFRMLRASLPFMGIGSKNKRILITSTMSGEGKSFIAVNLSLSLAMAGKKVVLVEFDLSNPTLAIKLGLEAQQGIADLLAGNAQINDVITKSDKSDNLYVIPAGNLPRNPSELIMSTRTEDILQYLAANFDYVIVDSAPVGLLSDGYVLARYCDATLFIVRHKHTPKKALERLERSKKINNLEKLAIVFNGVGTRGFGSNRYGYGNGYGYGYNYSQKQKSKS